MIFAIPAKAGIRTISAKLATRNQVRIASDKSLPPLWLRACLIIDAGSADVSPATPEMRNTIVKQSSPTTLNLLKCGFIGVHKSREQPFSDLSNTLLQG